MSELIATSEIEAKIKKIPEWEVEKKTLIRSFEFDEFMDGIDFVNGVAEIAEEANHHPDIDIRWGKVDVYLTTHSAGGLTESDFEVAKRIDTLMD